MTKCLFSTEKVKSIGAQRSKFCDSDICLSYVGIININKQYANLSVHSKHANTVNKYKAKCWFILIQKEDARTHG